MPPHSRTASPPPTRGRHRATQHVIHAMQQVREEPLSVPLFLLASLWIVQTFDVLWLLAVHGPDAILKLSLVLLLGLQLSLLFGVPINDIWRSRWQWYAPFLLYILVGFVTFPFVANKVVARDGLQWFLIWWTIIVGMVALVGSVRRVETLLALYGLQFLWFAAWGLPEGLIYWHPTMSNTDGYGALMVGGIAFCYFMGVSTHHKWLKLLMYIGAALSAIGVVASFARGAFLASVVVFGMVVLRSPNKARTLVAGLGCILVVFIAASVLFPDGAFWNEIASAFHEGTEEGTGEDRWILWGAAWQVFLERPIFGAGIRNWGAVAVGLFEHGELGGQYSNPGALYNMNLHSLYMTTLSELGLVGSFALIWLLVDYFKRNAALRTPQAAQNWLDRGGRIDLRPIALGLEAAMIGFLCNAFLYSMMISHWFFTMLAVNLVVHSVAVRLVPSAQPQTARRVRGGARSMHASPPPIAGPVTPQTLLR